MLGNLPSETTSFVGRAVELGRLGGLLEAGRLITLTGVGGVGKSRLALRTARKARSRYRDGVWWVDLSPLRDPRLLAVLIARTLGLVEQSARTANEDLCSWLSDKNLLLVLDTCEHLVAECRHLVAELLQSAPGLSIVASSRQPLGCKGELVCEVRPLPVDGTDCDALRLFRERARAVLPRQDLRDPRWTGAATEVCRQLDGIPLALELAGARLRMWTVQQVAERLGGRFEVLSDPWMSRPQRHRTMRTAIGWSHELCQPLERLLWARLSTFSGDFDIASAQAVCSGGPLGPTEVEQTLAGLVGKSVVRQSAAGPPARFRMLDTIREYGRHWLKELGEEHVVADRHARHYAALAQQAEGQWLGSRQLYWADRLSAEHTDLRTALEHLLASDPAQALEMAADLWFHWFCCGHLREGRQFLERALRSGPTEPSQARTRARWTLGITALLQGDLATSLGLGHQLVREREHEPKRRDEAHGRRRLSQPARHAAEAELRAAHLLGTSLLMPGDAASALEVTRGALRAAPQGLHRTSGGLLCRLATSYALCALGRNEEAASEAGALREVCAAAGEHWMRAYADYILALAALASGKPQVAARHARAMLAAKRLLRDSFGIALGLELLGAAIATQGGGEEAARLLGGGHAWWRAVGLPRMGSPSLEAIRASAEHSARSSVGDQAYERAFRSGVEAAAGW
ncbi:ATP-binding protein [Streptomyces sp. NPDC006879]|uniref:ATP-binding protein n=1 Tax=Streptomyces sp. NPDC006879 TaxID=3364767 RepID=UPI0036CEB439